uniref:DNA recombination protein recA n=1 Tax=Pseudomonas phage HRDY3 TaxID=3236930 RepID=A0AB39CE25_9VIRU
MPKAVTKAKKLDLKEDKASASKAPATKGAKSKVAKAVSKAVAEPAKKVFNPYANFEDEIDNMEKKVGLTSMSVSEKEDRLDTGSLCVNLQMAGGLLAGGWYTFYGEEQSCKTTLATLVMGSIIRKADFMGKAFFFDYEGSFSAEYANAMWKYNGNGKAQQAEEVFGVQDKEGNYLIRPRIRYFAPSVGEDFFDAMSDIMRKLPSVLKIDGEYYFIYANTKANQKLTAGFYDAKYFKKFNKFKVPAPHGLPQAVFLVDSYPAMLSRRADEKEDGTDGLASQARMFADGIKRVKGKMKEKRVLVLGINQLREVPMAMYGPDKKEPCGTALRFFADCRFRMSPISIPHGKGMMEEEPSISGEGVDTYRYIKCHAFKNKLGGPQKSNMVLRLYVANEDGEGLGFDRVWDTWMYLKETGQISGQRNKIKFGDGTPFAGHTLSWMDLKKMVDGDKNLIKAGCEKMKIKPIRLYEWCRRQIESGKGYDLYLDQIKNTHTKKAAKAAAAGDGDDEE